MVGAALTVALVSPALAAETVRVTREENKPAGRCTGWTEGTAHISGVRGHGHTGIVAVKED